MRGEQGELAEDSIELMFSQSKESISAVAQTREAAQESK